MAKRKTDDDYVEDEWLRAESRALGEMASERAESLGDALLKEGTTSAAEAMTWREAERFFIEGEDRVGLRSGLKSVWWPSAHHVALRFKLEPQEVERHSMIHRWWEKRFNYQRRDRLPAPAPEANPRALTTPAPPPAPSVKDQSFTEAEASEEVAPALPPTGDGAGPVDPLAVTEAVIRAFERQVREGAGLRAEAISAFDKAVRLRAFLLNDQGGGGSEGGQPVTLDELQRRHAVTRTAEAEADADAALSGVTALGDSGGGGGSEGEDRTDELAEALTRKPTTSEREAGTHTPGSSEARALGVQPGRAFVSGSVQ